MNILHHKSWHVYSQKNRDKVQEDEAKAEATEKEKEKEMIEKERDARLQLLRSKAQSRYRDTSVDVSNKALAAQAMSQRAQYLSFENQTNSQKLAIESGSDLSGFSTASLLSSLKSNQQLVERIPARSPSPVESHPLETLDFHREFLHHVDSNLKKDKDLKPLLEEKNKSKVKPPITNMFLTKGQENKPWYHKESFEHLPDSKKFSDQRVKSFHDPLESINKQLKQKSGPEFKNDSSKKLIVPKGIDKLRAERMEREARERERVRSLLSSSKSLSQGPTESQPFHNQYNSRDTYEAKHHQSHSPLAKKHKSKKSKKDKKEMKSGNSRSKY